MKLIRIVSNAPGSYIALVMACGFLTFYSLPDGVPFLVRLTMMVATQIAVGKAVRRRHHH